MVKRFYLVVQSYQVIRAITAATSIIAAPSESWVQDRVRGRGAVAVASSWSPLAFFPRDEDASGLDSSSCEPRGSPRLE